jgi:hypothetical protein
MAACVQTMLAGAVFRWEDLRRIAASGKDGKIRLQE